MADYPPEYLLESEEFYDLIYQIANHAIESRCGEKRTAFARIIKSAIMQDKSIFDLEDIVSQVAQTQEKDLLYLKVIKWKRRSRETLGSDLCLTPDNFLFLTL